VASTMDWQVCLLTSPRSASPFRSRSGEAGFAHSPSKLPDIEVPSHMFLSKYPQSSGDRVLGLFGEAVIGLRTAETHPQTPDCLFRRSICSDQTAHVCRTSNLANRPESMNA